MGLFTDTVPRDLYDGLQARYDDLLAKYHALRPTHSPVAPVRMIAPQPDSGQRALAAAEHAARSPGFMQTVSALVEAGSSDADAMREAERLYRIAKGREVAGSPP